MPNRLVRRAQRTLVNSLRLRCPRCGEGKLFQGWFTMNETCPSCGLVYEREAGYFVGAIYVNYGATAVLSLGGYLLLDFFVDLTLTQEVVLWCLCATIFPLWFFRYSRSLWLALDHILNPEPPTLKVAPRTASRRAS